MKKTTLFITYSLLIVVIISAFILNKKIWGIDSVISGFILTVIYLFRRRLNLTDFLFLLISILVLLHCFAVFGFFKMTIWGHEYDTYIHIYSSIIIALVTFNYVKKFNISLIETAFIALLISLGFGLSNELVEFAGYKLWGRGEGLFLLGPGDTGATNVFENLMTDFFNDFFSKGSG